MNISLDKLRYFLEVARLEHMGRASKSLGITTSAISTAISAIEEEYGCDLFERSHQRIFLNEKGKRLKEELAPIFMQLETLKDKVNGHESIFKGHLSLGGSYFLAQHFLQPVVQDIQGENSHISVELSPLRSTQVLHEVLSGVLDYGLCISPSGHPGLEKQILYTGKLCLVVARQHPLAKQVRQGTFKIKSLNDYPAAIHKFAPGIDYRETQEFERLGVEPDIKNFYHSEELAIQSLQASEMWAVVPDLVARAFKSDLCLLPLPKNWNASYEVCSLYRKSLKDRSIYKMLDQRLLKLF